jgi:CelD/BcsL family acetyltransferase involved in cellulose biosynthesis
MTSGGRYHVEINSSWEDFAPRWQRLAAANPGSPFQQASWLAAWFATLGRRPDVEPVLLAVSDKASTADVLLLPLVRRRRGPLRLIEFADLWVTDYCEPCLGPAAPTDRAGAQPLLDQIIAALPPADLLIIDKMPARVGNRINPLSLCADVSPSIHSGHLIDLDRDWDEYLLSLKKSFRSELRRSMRLLEAKGRVQIRAAETVDEALRFLAVLHRLQCGRFDRVGIRHPFSVPEHQQFYRAAVERGVANGSVMVSGIMLDNELVASSLLLRSGDRFTIMRFGFQDGEFDRIGLGRLLIEQTMKLAHEHGCKVLDLSIGATDLKRRLAATTELALFELIRPLSVIGASLATYQRVRRIAVASPLWRSIKGRLNRASTPKLPTAEEHP